MAQRALLDLHLSTRPDGAVVAGWYPGWDDAWPRDSSWVAVALAVSGHGADAYRVLTFLQREQSRDGTWAARYQPDGGGPGPRRPPGGTGRGRLGALGGLVLVRGQPSGASVAGRAVADGQRGRRRGPTVAEIRAACPCAATDYWEHGAQVTLGTAAPLLTGLRAAAAIAGRPRPGPGGPATGRTPPRGWPGPSRRVRLLWLQPAAGRLLRAGCVGHVPGAAVRARQPGAGPRRGRRRAHPHIARRRPAARRRLAGERGDRLDRGNRLLRAVRRRHRRARPGQPRCCPGWPRTGHRWGPCPSR